MDALRNEGSIRMLRGRVIGNITHVLVGVCMM